MKTEKKLILLVLSLINACAFSQTVIPAYVPTNSLVAWWPFNGNANDLSGNNNNGTVNGASLTTDRFGNASSSFSFNSSASISNTNNPVRTLIDNNSAYSLSLWINRDNTGNTLSSSSERVIFAFDGSNTPPYKRSYLRIGQQNNNSTYLWFGRYNANTMGNIGDVSIAYTTPLFLQPFTWNHICVVYNSTDAFIYVNGNLISNVLVDGTWSTGAQYKSTTMAGPDNYVTGFNAGSNNQNNATPFSGTLDDIGIWSRALTECEVKKLYYSPSFSLTASNQTICAGQSLTLTAGGVPNYSWSSGANTASTIVSPTASIIYTVTSTYTAGCSDSKTVAVTVNQNPSLMVNNSTLCLGESATLTASGATTYTWSTNANTSSIIVSPTVTTNYTVNGTGNSCTSAQTVQVMVSPCTGINELQTAHELSIHPNPNNGEFVIQSDSDMQIDITDQLGRKITVIGVKAGNNNYSLHNLAKGIYLLSGKTNNKVYKGKMVVQ